MQNNGNFEQIKAEIAGAVAKEREADRLAAQQEQEIKSKHEAARQRMAAALDAGNMEEYTAAGLDAESFRLKMEFIEEINKRGKKPGATAADDARIAGAIRAEYARIRADALAQLNTIFGEAAAVAADALQKFTALDGIYNSWSAVVMHRNHTSSICPVDSRLTLAQMEQAAKAQLNKFKMI